MDLVLFCLMRPALAALPSSLRFDATSRRKEAWQVGPDLRQFCQTSDKLCQSEFFCRVGLHLVNLGFF
jgi:hypothetical protein